MKKLILIAVATFTIGCSETPNPNFDGNVALTKEWFRAFEVEDIDALMAMHAENVEWQGAFYGMPLMNGIDALSEYMQGWHAAMDNIKYTPDNFLPGVDPETNLPNGSVRTYGTWSGVNAASGKSFEVKFYHYLTFDENGKIINGGDFGDATGVMMAVAPETE